MEIQKPLTKLRRLNEDDQDSLREWRNDPAVMRWCRQSDLISKAAQWNWFYSLDTDKTVSMYGIEVDNTLVGVCGLTSIDPVARRAEFSLYIAVKYQRNGFAKDALSGLLDKAFKDLNLHQVWGETFDGNPAADIFESLGFKPGGYRRDFYYKNGCYIGAKLYSILEDEWTLAH